MAIGLKGQFSSVVAGFAGDYGFLGLVLQKLWC